VEKPQSSQTDSLIECQKSDTCRQQSLKQAKKFLNCFQFQRLKTPLLILHLCFVKVKRPALHVVPNFHLNSGMQDIL
jgi:hypothetical protein